MTDEEMKKLVWAGHRAEEAVAMLLKAAYDRDDELASANLGLLCAIGFGPLSKNDKWLEIARKDKKFSEFVGIG